MSAVTNRSTLRRVRLLGANPLITALAIALLLLIFSFITSGGDLGSFGITVLSGVFQGMLLFLVAAGLSIVFLLIGLLNFPQGPHFSIGPVSDFAARPP